MAVRIVWDEYETALLIDTFWQIEKSPDRKQELIKGLSDALRQKALKSGVTIDEKFRNVNGISMQLSPIAHAFFPERPSLTTSVMFNRMVELYKTDRDAFNKTLFPGLYDLHRGGEEGSEGEGKTGAGFPARKHRRV